MAGKKPVDSGGKEKGKVPFWLKDSGKVRCHECQQMIPQAQIENHLRSHR